MKARLSPSARLDFRKILAYTMERWGETQADKYESLIGEAISEIEKNPRGGKTRPRDDIAKGLRFLKAGKHQIFYDVAEEYIVILRILHEKMDLGAHLRR